MSHSGHQTEAHRQKILVTGWRKAGKSSCIQTIFQHLPVKDVPYIGITQRIEKIDYECVKVSSSAEHVLTTITARSFPSRFGTRLPTLTSTS